MPCSNSKTIDRKEAKDHLEEDLTLPAGVNAAAQLRRATPATTEYIILSA
jgi:hypothetical protein